MTLNTPCPIQVGMAQKTRWRRVRVCRASSRSSFFEGDTAPIRDRSGLEDGTGLNSDLAFCLGDADTASLSLSFISQIGIRRAAAS